MDRQPAAHVDAYDRPIRYLRISVTDRCNLRCVYCMPPKGVPWRLHEEILRYEEIETVVKAASALGIHRVRLTGGEPLVRRGIIDLVRMIARVPGIDDLAMTTNGTLLARYATELAAAGLHRVNVSLDTLEAARFRRITRRDDLADVLAGIDAAHQVGLQPVKLNTVVIRGLNDNEVVNLAIKTTHPDGWHVRFIERMPLGGEQAIERRRAVTAREIRQRIETALGALEPAERPIGGGPARYYRLPGAAGTIGFISPVSHHVCKSCNRLRLTADGQLRPCLLSDREIDLRTPLRRGADVESIQALLVAGIACKPKQHHLADSKQPAGRVMSEIGG